MGTGDIGHLLVWLESLVERWEATRDDKSYRTQVFDFAERRGVTMTIPVRLPTTPAKPS